ncbi:ANL_collapsed_G0047620.mRNA.1.CDS.1 [Saccharomyces cerevisiae]|uniref:K7_Mrpl50p n=2 Tax=Saccharomyces cerevisiae TaxID=4932 RepID=G2WL79_YEASK|nr:Mrpl50p [Saccharomyces cerevisiae YJM195]AJT04765.1 Mrpl50p [Saccharomyces cerevisiae YJM326]AJT05135.1 Mrpl50p [Saccharomyces cerevisiae YJM428]AJT05889.1 Mrpl50p [Saccharomyces cerevisiae YJM451]AJT07004.1 Mrpl50p [Saccharomyces cerevisiae YJM470]AJT16409.1 Mrpl50p [Saccharomyces cerevisiae YJM1208]AJT17535.1 Mrpl50p [Saccharomyces cerevisiae YJM1248]AJT18659.1 Mrpl50p [Saccharomyces cerevisiae YJM1273]AJT19029.1 Mrpl50p [Saccharomyces cerevisiae YJM1304]AJT19396.1 Mrpl50p [Saccharomy
MLHCTQVCLSALTKRTHRVKVQVLKDFPRFQLYKGQVANVKPSLMRNYLHNFNGAKYILSEEHDINTELLKQYQTREAKLEEDRQQLSKRHETEVQKNMELRKESVFGHKKEEKPKEEKKGLLDSGITIEEVKIPGLDI